jgi:hypothetical protein
MVCQDTCWKSEGYALFHAGYWDQKAINWRVRWPAGEGVDVSAVVVQMFPVMPSVVS